MKIHYEITKIRKVILNSKKKFIKGEINTDILNKFNIPLNISITQRLFQLLITNKFNQKLINYFERNVSVVHPLPKEWIYILEENNIRVSKLSSLLFQLIKIKIVIKSLIILFTCVEFKKDRTKISFNYLSNVNKNIFINFEPSNNLISWLNKYFQDNIEYYYHDNKKLDNLSINNKSLIYKKIIVLESIFLFPKLILESIIIFFNNLFNNSISLVLFDEIIKLLIISKKKNNFPEKIIFDHSESLFKPLWTYFFEKKNIENIVYFYSTNNVPIVYDKDKVDRIDNYISHGWELMNWKNYFVWDNYQKDFFSNYFNLEKSFFKITGPIPFGGKPFQITTKKKIISIFDVSPFSTLIFKKFCHPEEYYIFDNIKKFYETIIKSNSDYHMVFKIKRISKLTDLNYIKYIQSLKKKGFDIRDDICPFSLIKSSSKVISLPFSSPSIIARTFNVESIFFDPSNKLKFLNDYKFINHDIKILYDNEIKNWI